MDKQTGFRSVFQPVEKIFRIEAVRHPLKPSVPAHDFSRIFCRSDTCHVADEDRDRQTTLQSALSRDRIQASIDNGCIFVNPRAVATHRFAVGMT